MRKEDETRLVMLDDVNRREAELYVSQSSSKDDWRIVIEEMPGEPHPKWPQKLE